MKFEKVSYGDPKVVISFSLKELRELKERVVTDFEWYRTKHEDFWENLYNDVEVAIEKAVEAKTKE